MPLIHVMFVAKSLQSVLENVSFSRTFVCQGRGFSPEPVKLLTRTATATGAGTCSHSQLEGFALSVAMIDGYSKTVATGAVWRNLAQAPSQIHAN